MDISEEIQKAIGIHGKWKLYLREAIQTGRSDMTIQSTKPDNLCELGKWLYGPSIPEYAKSHHYKEVIETHAQFHEIAAKVLEFALSGDTLQARGLMDTEYSLVSSNLCSALKKWKESLLHELKEN